MSMTFSDQVKSVMESVYRLEYKMRFKHLYEDIVCATLPGDAEIRRKCFAFERISKYLKREASCQYLKLPSHPHHKWRCRRDEHTIEGIDPRPHCWNCLRRIPLPSIHYERISHGHKAVIIEKGLPGYRKYFLRMIKYQKTGHVDRCRELHKYRPRWNVIRHLENLLWDQITPESNEELRSTCAFPYVNPSLTTPVLDGGVHAV